MIVAGRAQRAAATHSGLVALILFVVAFCIYLPTTSHGLISSDVWSANFASWHLVTTGTPHIDGLYLPRLTQDPSPDVWIRPLANGHTVIGRAPGVIAITLPAYWLLHPATMSLLPGNITAALLTAGAVALMFLALTNRLTTAQAALAAVLFGFTTPVWSISANGLWPQTVTAFGFAGMAWACEARRWWLVGMFGGVALWARLPAAVIVAMVGLYLGWRRRDRTIVLKVGGVSGLFLVLMCAWSKWMFATWDPAGSYDLSTSREQLDAHAFSLVNQLGALISPDRGILVWTPLIVLLLPALVRSWTELPDWSRALFVAGVVHNVTQACLTSFTGGTAFYGYRYGITCLACATPALALAAPHMGVTARRLFGPVAALQLLAFVTGALYDNLWLDKTQVWHANVFLSSMQVLGTRGWALVVLFLGAGVAAGRLWPYFTGPAVSPGSSASEPEWAIPEARTTARPAAP